MTAIARDTALRTELTVGGMHCGNCVRHVQEALAEILLDAIDEAGYEVAVRGPEQ